VPVARPNHHPAISPLPRVRMSCAKMAFVGVLYFECTLANNLGKAPLRPSAYHMRVLTLAVASVTAKVDERNAIRISHQPPPQSLRARARPGRSGEVWMPLMLSTPKPVMTP